MAEEYISKNEILDYIKDVYEQAFISLEARQMVSAFKAYVSNLPTADVVEVVRCSECKNAEKMTEFRTDCTVRCSRFDKSMVDNDFCSYGESKENRKCKI